MPTWPARTLTIRKLPEGLLSIWSQQKLQISRTVADDMKNATYSFRDEDHTLGNLVRNQLVKNKQVEFCAYSIPHPSEPICNVRI